METVSDVLRACRGWATARQLVAATSRRALAAAVARGEVERLSRGIYVLPGLSADLLTAVAYDGVLSHLSAAKVWDLPLLVQPPKPHVMVPVKRHARPGPPAVLHWAATSRAERQDRVTSLPRTVLDCARILPFAEALAVADKALASGHLHREELLSGAHALRGPGRTNVCRVAASATDRSGSFLESLLRALLISEDVAGFEPQVLVTNGAFRARVDLGHREARVALEADGYEFHGGRRDFTADCHRYDELVAAGWLVLRITYEQVLGDPDWVITTVRRALTVAANRATGGPGRKSRTGPHHA